MKMCLASVIAATMLLASDKECQSDKDKIAGCVEKNIFLGFRVETPYKDGEKNGVEKEWYYENGGLRSEIPYKDGEKNGVAKEWYYENGGLRSEIPYKDGKENGVEKQYYKNGKLASEKPYKNGRLDGVVKTYYKNGGLKVEVSYKDGQKDGVGKWYYDNGEPFAVVVSENGWATSAKCYNGSIPTNAQLHNFSQLVGSFSDLCGEVPLGFYGWQE